MVAFFRQFLVLLLVLLQYASPLVHAHTGNEVSESGIHLYEFEALHIASEQSAFASVKHAVYTESCIVNVGSAIKTKQQPDSLQAVLAPSFYPRNLPASGFCKLVNFTPQPNQPIPKPLLAAHFCRAPPSLY